MFLPSFQCSYCVSQLTFVQIHIDTALLTRYMNSSFELLRKYSEPKGFVLRKRYFVPDIGKVKDYSIVAIGR